MFLLTLYILLTHYICFRLIMRLIRRNYTNIKVNKLVKHVITNNK